MSWSACNGSQSINQSIFQSAIRSISQRCYYLHGAILPRFSPAASRGLDQGESLVVIGLQTSQSINQSITQSTGWTILTRSSPAASRGLDRASARGKSRGTKCVARRPPTSDASWPGNNMQLGMVTCMYLCMHVIVLVDWARNCRDLVTLQGCHVSWLLWSSHSPRPLFIGQRRSINWGEWW